MSFIDHRCNVCGHWRYQRKTDPRYGCQGGATPKGIPACRCTSCDYHTPPTVVPTISGDLTPPGHVTGFGYRTCGCADCQDLAATGVQP